MYYHVTTSEGVISETNIERDAYALAGAISGATVRMGSLQGLREASERRFGKQWLVGPSTIAKLSKSMAA